jgi:hypothetical protein
MGIFILDQITTNFGVSLANTYCSIRGSYSIRKRGDNYVLSTCAGIWADKQSYSSNKEMLERPIIYEQNLTLGQLDDLLKTGVHVYENIYNGIKSKLGYQNYSNDV